MNAPSTEVWAAGAALLAALAAAAKKFLGAKKQPRPDYVTRAEFREEMNGTRARIDALADQMQTNQAELLSALEKQASGFEQRIDRLEIFIARLDERTTVRN